jgi:hypothetical protein
MALSSPPTVIDVEIVGVLTAERLSRCSARGPAEVALRKTLEERDRARDRVAQQRLGEPSVAIATAADRLQQMLQAEIVAAFSQLVRMDLPTDLATRLRRTRAALRTASQVRCDQALSSSRCPLSHSTFAQSSSIPQFCQHPPFLSVPRHSSACHTRRVTSQSSRVPNSRHVGARCVFICAQQPDNPPAMARPRNVSYTRRPAKRLSLFRTTASSSSRCPSVSRHRWWP